MSELDDGKRCDGPTRAQLQAEVNRLRAYIRANIDPQIRAMNETDDQSRIDQLDAKLRETERESRSLHSQLTQARQALNSKQPQLHHEVLCTVLKELIGQVTPAGRHVAESNPHASWEELVATARHVADLAYPPPSAAEDERCPRCDPPSPLRHPSPQDES